MDKKAATTIAPIKIDKIESKQESNSTESFTRKTNKNTNQNEGYNALPSIEIDEASINANTIVVQVCVM